MKVTRIEKEHVGMEIPYSGIITAVGNIFFLCLYENEEQKCVRNGLWEIRSPAKPELKPSERINQMIGKTSFDHEWQERAIEKTIEYLDELRSSGVI